MTIASRANPGAVSGRALFDSGAPVLARLVGIDQSGAEEGGVGDVVGGDERARRVCDSSDGQTVETVDAEGEIGGEDGAGPVVRRARGVDGRDDGDVLLVDVDEAQPLDVGGGDGHAEPQDLVGRLDVGREQGQLAEDGHVDGVGVGARAGHDEVLLQGRVRELARRLRQEGQLRRRVARQQRAVPAVLLAFLADDGDDGADQPRVAVAAELDGHVLQRAEHDGRDVAGRLHGAGQVDRRRFEQTRRDRRRVEVSQQCARRQRVPLLLRLDHDQVARDLGLQLRVRDLEPRHVVRDVEEQLRHVVHLVQLLEHDHLEAADVVGREMRRRRRVGQRPARLRRQLLVRRRAVGDVGEAVRQRENN